MRAPVMVSGANSTSQSSSATSNPSTALSAPPGSDKLRRGLRLQNDAALIDLHITPIDLPGGGGIRRIRQLRHFVFRQLFSN
jgi:hypothetical protein